MKRIVLAVFGTVLGLVGLLSFKSHSQPVVGATLPSAALAGGAAGSTSPTATATSAPPDPAPTATGTAAAPAGTSAAARSYDGSAVQTRYGTVQVQVTVAGSKITNVSFLQLTGTDGRSNEINSQAAPYLLQETLAAQSSHIDTISGATYTTDGYVQSLQSALDQAGIVSGAAGIELAAGPAPRRRIERCMGTVFSIEVRWPGCSVEAVEAAVSSLHSADRIFSTYDPASQLSRLARGELAIGDCAPEVGEVLARCAELEAETAGYFSATADGALDPSGLVKGWAIQRASDLLVAAGSSNHCVNGGGDVQCVGAAHRATPWRIGIADPSRPGRLAGTVVGCDLAVATSGTAERGRHITDPHTGSRPDQLASVSVIGPQVAVADAYATAAFAMGQAAPAWLESLDDYQALIVYPDGRRWSSTGLATAA